MYEKVVSGRVRASLAVTRSHSSRRVFNDFLEEFLTRELMVVCIAVATSP
jgi:hypothetical protein